MTFQEKLVILRKSKGLTQDDFASAVGVSRQAVYKWESGQSYPEVPKLLEMKMLFSISLDELLDDSYDLPVPDKKKRKRAAKIDAPKAEKPAVKAAPVAQPAPKAEPKPAPQPAPAAQPAPKAEPKLAPQPAPAAQPAPKAEPKPVEEPKVDVVPTPDSLAQDSSHITMEDLKNDEPAKKGGFFERLFGRR